MKKYEHPEHMWACGDTLPIIQCYTFRTVSYYIKQHHKTLLDLGCGMGRELFYWHKKGLSVVGADIEEQDMPFPFKIVDLDDTETILPWNNNSFDVVTLIHTIEHLENPEYAIREAYRIARDMVVVVAPFANSYKSEDHIQAWYSFDEILQDLKLGEYNNIWLELMISKPEDIEYATPKETDEGCMCEVKFRDVSFVVVIYKGEIGEDRKL